MALTYGQQREAQRLGKILADAEIEFARAKKALEAAKDEMAAFSGSVNVDRFDLDGFKVSVYVQNGRNYLDSSKVAEFLTPSQIALCTKRAASSIVVRTTFSKA